MFKKHLHNICAQCWSSIKLSLLKSTNVLSYLIGRKPSEQIQSLSKLSLFFDMSIKFKKTVALIKLYNIYISKKLEKITR